MERDLNGFPILDIAEIAGRRVALDMAAMVESAIAAIAAGVVKPRRIEPDDLIPHKPKAKWTRKDGSTGQREAWRRQLSGHQSAQSAKARRTKESA